MTISAQEILNAVRVDGDGNAITLHESLEQAIRAVFDSSLNALRVRLDESSDLYQRVTALEDTDVYAEYFAEVENASGTLACSTEIGTDAVFIANAFGDGIDAYVSEIGADGNPTGDPALDTSGDPLTIHPSTGFILGGTPSGATANYTLSGNPADDSVCVIFQYKQPRKHFDYGKTLFGYAVAVPDPIVVSTIRAKDGNGIRIEDDDGNGLTMIDGGALEFDEVSNPGYPASGKVRLYPSSSGFFRAVNTDVNGFLRPVIDSPITLTCSATGGGDFVGDAAINNALSAMNKYAISPSATVTIAIAPGVYGASTPLSSLYITHPNADRIMIQGNTGEAVAFPVANAVSAPNTSNNYIYVDNQSGAYGASDFSPGGDYDDFVVYVYGSTGNDGVYSVSAAVDDGTDIRFTLNETVHDATKDGTLYLLAANNYQLHFAAGNSGVQRPQAGVVKMFGLLLKGDISSGWPAGMYADAPGSGFVVYNMILKNWQAGLNMTGNSGVITWGGTATRPALIMTDCVAYGLTIVGSTYSGNHTLVGNCGIGVDCRGGACVNAAYAMAAACTTGFYANRGGSIDVSNGRIYNNATGCKSSSNATLYRTGMVSVGNTTPYSPAVGTEGSDFGVII